MEASDDFGALERLSLAVLGSEVHETGPSDPNVSVHVLRPTIWLCAHLILGQADVLATPCGEPGHQRSAQALSDSDSGWTYEICERRTQAS